MKFKVGDIVKIVALLNVDIRDDVRITRPAECEYPEFEEAIRTERLIEIIKVYNSDLSYNIDCKWKDGDKIPESFAEEELEHYITNWEEVINNG